jgi:RES domain
VNLALLVADIEPRDVRGTFERHCALRWEGLRPSTAGGRWGARGAYDVLYLGRPRDSVVVEAYRHLVEDELDAPAELATTLLERRLLTCDVAVTNFLDLRPADVREHLGLGEGALRSAIGDYAECQSIGAAAHGRGLSGVLAPAASGLGETIALFTSNLPRDQMAGDHSKRDLARTPAGSSPAVS